MGMRTSAHLSTTLSCPCGSGRAYSDCCGRFHAGEPAPDAENLMRSRYCAYVLEDEAYLRSTWHATTRPVRLDINEEPKTRWLGLEVRRQAATGEDSAIVEFVARFKIGGRARQLHETSRFVRENGRWYYVDGEFPDTGGAG
jgi:SEC-C motif-containing protein